MAAPSYMPTGVASIERYAAAEAAIAFAAARERGVEPAEFAKLSDGMSYAGSNAIDRPTPQVLCLVTFVSRAWPEAFDEVLDVGGV
jgi:hypothetical protein